MTTRAIEALSPRHLLHRILDTPHLAQAIQSLEPRVLYQLVRHCGLEDCGEIVALATTEQLTRVFDEDLWRSDEGGEDDQFDADRLALWLEVLVEVGVTTAAQKLALMDFDFVVAALSRHLLVLDQESLVFDQAAPDVGADELDPLANARAVLTENALEDLPSHEVGGFMVIAKRGESWDALLSIVMSLADDHPRFFGKLMKRCCRLTTEHIEDNGGLYEVLTADQQILSDIGGERERRREEEGFVSPSQATAFLTLARKRLAADDAAAPGVDPVSAGYFRDLEHRARARGEGHRAPDPKVIAFLATLQEGGVLESPRPARLLKVVGGGGTRRARIRAQLQHVLEHDAAAYSRRTEELAYLANVLVAGCAFRSRRFRAVEAADAVLAICNLGLENWTGLREKTRATLPRTFLLRQDLVAVFRTGWNVLYEGVCLYVAGRLVEILRDLRCDDVELQDGLHELRRRMKKQITAGTPWRERDNLDVIAILDPPSWATLLGLVDECPVVPKTVETPGDGQRPLRVASDFEFVSENSQIAWVRSFLDELPQRLAEA